MYVNFYFHVFDITIADFIAVFVEDVLKVVVFGETLIITIIH